MTVKLKTPPPATTTTDTTSDIQATLGAMRDLAVTVQTGSGPETYFEADGDYYKSSFTRDSLVAMGLCGEPRLLLGQIDYSAKRLGKREDPHTGEEPGKAHHQMPGVTRKGLDTGYNACDTTAELLSKISAMAEAGHAQVLDKYGSEIEAGTAYILRHVNNQGLFVEDPLFAGAYTHDIAKRHFALDVTYWKDSHLNRPGKTEPEYPIVYSLAHFQNAEALHRIGRATGNERLVSFGRYMADAGLEHLWKNDHFVTAIDMAGPVDAPSSDSLHVLLYLDPARLSDGMAQSIQDYTRALETEAGYRAGLPSSEAIDPYHMQVWTHEQALLHAAARRHGLEEAETVTSRIVDFINPSAGLFPELIIPDTYVPGSNTRQLWAMGAYLYFQNPGKALL